MRILRKIQNVEIDKLKAGDRLSDTVVMEIPRQTNHEFTDLLLLLQDGSRKVARFPRGTTLKTLEMSFVED